MKSLLSYILLSTQLIAAYTLKKRITDGTQLSPQDYPFMVSLDYDSLQRCAGTLLAPTLLITAAHCTEKLDPARWTASFTRTTVDAPFRRVNISQIYTHPAFNVSSYSYDVALFILSEAVNTPTAFLDDGSYSQITQQVNVIGYGEVLDPSTKNLVTTESLNGIQMQIADNQVCANFYANQGWVVDGSMQCMTGLGGSCNGDSGGPVFVNAGDKVVLVGIISWGLPGTCGTNQDPSVNTNVANVLDWVYGISQGIGITMPMLSQTANLDSSTNAATDPNASPNANNGALAPIPNSSSADPAFDPNAASLSVDPSIAAPPPALDPSLTAAAAAIDPLLAPTTDPNLASPADPSLDPTINLSKRYFSESSSASIFLSNLTLCIVLALSSV